MAIVAIVISASIGFTAYADNDKDKDKKDKKDKECIDPSQINPLAVCPAVYAPVCGCNGITYSNSCFAYNAGVTSWTEGECGTDGGI